MYYNPRSKKFASSPMNNDYVAYILAFKTSMKWTMYLFHYRHISARNTMPIYRYWTLNDWMYFNALAFLFNFKSYQVRAGARLYKHPYPYVYVYVCVGMCICMYLCMSASICFSFINHKPMIVSLWYLHIRLILMRQNSWP